MTVQQLISKALKRLGNTSPKPEQVADAKDSLNMAVNIFTYWDDTICPVTEFTTLDEDVNLPYPYIECLINLTAAIEAPAYGQDPTYFEVKVKDLQGKMTFPNAQALRISACVTEVI